MHTSFCVRPRVSVKGRFWYLYKQLNLTSNLSNITHFQMSHPTLPSKPSNMVIDRSKHIQMIYRLTCALTIKFRVENQAYCSHTTDVLVPVKRLLAVFPALSETSMEPLTLQSPIHPCKQYISLNSHHHRHLPN